MQQITLFRDKKLKKFWDGTDPTLSREEDASSPHSLGTYSASILSLTAHDTRPLLKSVDLPLFECNFWTFFVSLIFVFLLNCVVADLLFDCIYWRVSKYCYIVYIIFFFVIWINVVVYIGWAGTFTEAPKIDLSKLAGREIRVKAGEPIRVDVPVTGSPPPLVSWQKDNKSLSPSDRVSFWHLLCLDFFLDFQRPWASWVKEHSEINPDFN